MALYLIDTLKEMFTTLLAHSPDICLDCQLLGIQMLSKRIWTTRPGMVTSIHPWLS